ncbi:MAG: hypothetical protein ABWK53_03895 [Anaerolineales bacterium]
MLRRLAPLLTFSFLLAACGPLAVQERPVPTSGLLAPTPDLVSPEPSSTPTETATATPPPFYPPTATATPLPTPAPAEAAIQINIPGPLSKVTSPIYVRGYVIPGYNNRVRVELFGEDGRLLARQVTSVYTSSAWAYLSVDLRFEIGAAGELGRLSISTEDRFGRLQALHSVHVLLLSEGEDQINPPEPPRERCLLSWPLPGGQVSGSILLVEGYFRPLNRQPLVIELVSETGQVIATRLVTVEPAPDDSYVPFAVDVPYLIEAPLWARLVVRQADDRIPGTMYLYSQEIALYP